MANSCVSGGMGQHEFTQRRIEREAVHPVADGEHQHGGGAIQRVTGGDLLHAGLKKISLQHIGPGLRPAQHRKNAADRHIDVNIA